MIGRIPLPNAVQSGCKAVRSPFRIVFVLVLGLVGGPDRTGAQPWSPSLDLIVLQDVEYGSVTSSTSIASLSRTDAGVGVVEVRAKVGGERVEVVVTVAQNPTSSSGPELPLDLRVAYNDNQNSPGSATTVSEGQVFTLRPRADQVPDPPGPPVRSAYIYLYGNVDVSGAPSSSYQGELSIDAELVHPGGGSQGGGPPGGGPPGGEPPGGGSPGDGP